MVAALFVSGLLIIGLCGLVTWIVGIYSTFRVAGPLYHFTTNIDMELEQLTPPKIVIHSKDHMRREAEDLESTFTQVNNHYLRLGYTLNTLIQQLTDGADEDQVPTSDLIQRFLDEEENVRLDE